MKLIRQLAATLLLLFGIPFSIFAISELANPNAKNKEGSLAALIIFTLPSSALGGWLAWGLYRQNQQELSDRLQTTFYNLLKQGNGEITVLRFAMEANLTANVAKGYLDQKAKEFNAAFNVSEDGLVSYKFESPQ